MKVTTEELERCEVLMTIEVDPAQEQNLLKKAAKKIARQVQIPGFRPGKAPYHTVVRRFGLEAVQQEVFEDSGEKIIQDALVEANLRPFAQISFDEISWDPLTIKVKVPGPPKIELEDYRALRLEAKPVEVSDDDVKQALEALQDQNATWAPVERPAELNDLISMSVVEKDGDELLAEHDSVEYELVLPEKAETDESAPTGPLADLTTPLLGLSAGEEKTFTVNYPEDFSDNRYAGKEITLTVNVSSVKVKELDPLDDDFALAVSDFDTLEELKEKLRKNIQDRRQLEADQELGQEMLDKIIAEAREIEWPVALEEEMIDAEVKHFADQLEQSGLRLDSYLSIQNKSEADLREEIREKIIERLKIGVVLGELARLEKLAVSNTEILEQAKSIADSFGGDDQIWQYILSSDTQQNRIANEMLTTKVLLRLAAVAKGEAPEPDAEAEATEAPVAADSDDSPNEKSEAPVVTQA